MNLPDWIHCNVCFHEQNSRLRFYLTSCGHLICEQCIDSPNFTVCKLCTHAGSIVKIDSNMKPDVAMLFSDPLQILQKAFQQLAKVLKFQTGHTKRLDFMRKQKANNSDPYEQDKYIRQLQHENELLKRELKAIPLGTNEYEIQRSVVANQNASSSSSIKNSSKSTIKSSRITLRTPPVNGRMGNVQRSKSPPQTMNSVSLNEVVTNRISNIIPTYIEKSRDKVEFQKPNDITYRNRNQNMNPKSRKNNSPLINMKNLPVTNTFLMTPNFHKK